MRFPFLFVLVFVILVLAVVKIFFLFVIKFWFIALPIAGYLGWKIYKLQQRFIANRTFVDKPDEQELDPCKQVKGGSCKVVK